MKDILFEVVENKVAARDIYCLRLRCNEVLPQAYAGQFLHLEVPDKSLILRRPFCIYDCTDSVVTTYYAVVGKGTECLARVQKGEKLKVILSLGSGFEISEYKRIALLGGGMGCAELYSVTKTPNKEFYAYFGFANKDRVAFLDDFSKTVKKLNVFTDDGSFGKKGYAIPKLMSDIVLFDAVLMCGPTAMVRAAKTAFKDIEIPVFVSLEQRMGCGVGACLVCTCKINEDGKIKNKRVCMDGPVFNLKDVVL